MALNLFIQNVMHTIPCKVGFAHSMVRICYCHWLDNQHLEISLDFICHGHRFICNGTFTTNQGGACFLSLDFPIHNKLKTVGLKTTSLIEDYA